MAPTRRVLKARAARAARGVIDRIACPSLRHTAREAACGKAGTMHEMLTEKQTITRTAPSFWPPGPRPLPARVSTERRGQLILATHAEMRTPAVAFVFSCVRWTHARLPLEMRAYHRWHTRLVAATP